MKIKNILRIYILLYFALFAWEAQASSETENVELITYPENAFSKIEKVIRQARKSIDIYAYHLKHLKVVDLLIQKKRENVSIRVIAEHDQYKHAFNKESSTEAYSKLANAGIPIHQKPKYYRKNHPTGHFHAKFILVDNETLLLTSGGFDGMTFDVCRDLGVILHQKDYSTELREAHNLFLADWVNQPYRNSSDSSRLIIGPEGQKEIFHNFLRS
ncbi:MAG: hypothetical protein HOI80_06635, partial [Alphaproteobacteria bacterium]|nr:hypothetical protein [Alphaproteobacteria bacterium]